MKKHKIYLFAYIALILVISSIPGESVPSVVHLIWDKVLHFVEYGILGILLRRTHKKGDFIKTINLCFYGIVVGCIDELWQTLVPGRNGSHFDLMADALGVIFGVIISNYFLNK